MNTMFFPSGSRQFIEHPKFEGVKLAKLVAEGKSDMVSVSELIIDPGVAVPVHTHDPQIDSIYVVSGRGEAFINGEWTGAAAGDYIFVPALVEHGVRNISSEPLRLFIHHSPPFL